MIKLNGFIHISLARALALAVDGAYTNMPDNIHCYRNVTLRAMHGTTQRKQIPMMRNELFRASRQTWLEDARR
jgi:hypothetical protein